MKKSFVLLMAVSLFYTTSGQNNAVPSPIVTGPVTGPGSIFSASCADLSPYCYIEEEFFLEGNARRYDFNIDTVNAKQSDPAYPGSFFYYLNGIPGNAIPIGTLYPYKTRIIVRRPAIPEKFNGTVVVEWLNVASLFDIDPNWYHLHDHLMRSGYAWVGVSAEKGGIHTPKGLRNWNPARYGSLDVSADSTLFNDELRFDIYSQAVMALKGEQKVRPLGNLRPEIIIASGHSRSAYMLTGYFNFIQPIAGIIDGFIILGAGGMLRNDVPAKVFKMNAETDLIELWQIPVRQPDSGHRITWEFAGTSHADQVFRDAYVANCTRDLGTVPALECEKPLCSVIPFYYGFSAALNHLNQWIREKIAPPAGIPITVQQTQPVVILERDTLGNVSGGIRLPQFAVPVAMNSGINAGSLFCKMYGTHKEFDQKTLKSLYPAHQAYLKKFNASVLENFRAGYILKADTSAMMNEARRLSNLWH